jgi:hypothetical protein
MHCDSDDPNYHHPGGHVEAANLALEIAAITAVSRVLIEEARA